MQTVLTLIRRCTLWHLIWSCTACQSPFYGMPGISGLIPAEPKEHITKFSLSIWRDRPGQTVQTQIGFHTHQCLIRVYTFAIHTAVFSQQGVKWPYSNFEPNMASISSVQIQSLNGVRHCQGLWSVFSFRIRLCLVHLAKYWIETFDQADYYRWSTIF